jgi:hypothetical protein
MKYFIRQRGITPKRFILSFRGAQLARNKNTRGFDAMGLPIALCLGRCLVGSSSPTFALSHFDLVLLRSKPNLS